MVLSIAQSKLLSAQLLYKILVRNYLDIKDPIFESTIKNLKADIEILYILDSFIHDDIKDILDNYDNLLCLLKSDFKNVEINDIIYDSKVIAIFTFTILISKK